jgi:hypothetical protein
LRLVVDFDADLVTIGDLMEWKSSLTVVEAITRFESWMNELPSFRKPLARMAVSIYTPTNWGAMEIGFTMMVAR